jgi:hypothetical protein
VVFDLPKETIQEEIEGAFIKPLGDNRRAKPQSH